MIISAAFAAEEAAQAAGHGSIWQDPTFWVGFAFCMTVLILAKPAGRALNTILQARADKIAAKLEEAKKLREEARTLLLNYQKKQQDTQKEIDALLQKVQDDAQKIKAEAQASFEQKLQKREEQAMNRLKMAQEKAIEEVRNLAVNIALTSAENILRQNLNEEAGKQLIARQIEDLPNLLNKNQIH